MIRAMRRFWLRSEAAFYAARASWREGQQSRLPDAQTGIESAVRHSELTDKIGKDRWLAKALQELADELQ